jgi:hypothetical protein
MQKPSHTDNDDRPGSGWSALACALIESAIRERSANFIESGAFEAMLELAGVGVDPDVCRAAIRARWLADRGRP